MNIYSQYTGKDNSRVLSNLRFIAETDRQNNCSTNTDREESHKAISKFDCSKFDLFTYKH